MADLEVTWGLKMPANQGRESVVFAVMSGDCGDTTVNTFKPIDPASTLAAS
jgi:hypothetical protein